MTTVLRPLFACRCSDCTATTETAEGMRAHYSVVHHWTADLDTVRATEMRYRELAHTAYPQLVRQS